MTNEQLTKIWQNIKEEKRDAEEIIVKLKKQTPKNIYEIGYQRGRINETARILYWIEQQTRKM